MINVDVIFIKLDTVYVSSIRTRNLHKKKETEKKIEKILLSRGDLVSKVT